MCLSALCDLVCFVKIQLVIVCTSSASVGVVPPSCIRVEMIKSCLTGRMQDCHGAESHFRLRVAKSVL